MALVWGLGLWPGLLLSVLPETGTWLDNVSMSSHFDHKYLQISVLREDVLALAFSLRRCSLHGGEGMATGSSKGREVYSCDSSHPQILGEQEVDSRQEEGPVSNLQSPPLWSTSSSATLKKAPQLSKDGVPVMFWLWIFRWAFYSNLSCLYVSCSLLL